MFTPSNSSQTVPCPGAVLDPEFWGGGWPLPSLPSHPFLSPHHPSLPLPTPPFPLPTSPLPLEVGPLNAARNLESAVSSPSGVWGEAPADKRFRAHLGQNEQLWCQQFHGFSQE